MLLYNLATIILIDPCIETLFSCEDNNGYAFEVGQGLANYPHKGIDVIIQTMYSVRTHLPFLKKLLNATKHFMSAKRERSYDDGEHANKRQHHPADQAAIDEAKQHYDKVVAIYDGLYYRLDVPESQKKDAAVAVEMAWAHYNSLANQSRGLQIRHPWS